MKRKAESSITPRQAEPILLCSAALMAKRSAARSLTMSQRIIFQELFSGDGKHQMV